MKAKGPYEIRSDVPVPPKRVRESWGGIPQDEKWVKIGVRVVDICHLTPNWAATMLVEKYPDIVGNTNLQKIRRISAKIRKHSGDK